MADPTTDSQHGPPTDLTSTSIIDYIDGDTRPTFIIDISRSGSLPSAAIVHRNQSFSSFEDAFLRSDDETRSKELANSLAVFFAKSYSNSSGLFDFRDISWSASTLKGRWRIISGTPLEHLRHHSTNVSTVSSDMSSANTDSTSGPAHTSSSVSEDWSSHGLFFPATSSPHLDLLREIDWSNSPVGPVAGWSPTWRNCVQHTLSNATAAAVFLGPERIVVYNEAYCPLIGSTHPHIIGTSAKTGWDWWPHYESLCQKVEATGQAVRSVAAEGPLLERDVFLQETFFTYCMMPIFDAQGKIVAVCNEVFDVTQDMYAKGRMHVLQKTSEIATAATSQENLWETTLRILQDATKDVPLATIFLADHEESPHGSDGGNKAIGPIETWVSKGSVGFPNDQSTTLESWNSTDPLGFETLMRKVVHSTGSAALTASDEHFPGALLQNCRYKDRPHNKLILCPLTLSSGVAVGCIILGINPVRPYDDDYQHFVQVLARQIEDAYNLVVLVEAQRRLLQETVHQAAITQRLLTEKLEQQTWEAKEGAQRFLNFANQAQVGVFVLDADGSVQYSNDTWRALMGVPLEEANDRESKHRWLPRVHPDDKAYVDQEWHRLLEGKVSNTFEFRMVYDSSKPDEAKITHIRASAFPERGQDGKIRTVTGIVTDRSLEVENERITNARADAALEEKRAQEYFMDMTSHEMRNPLNAMIQCAEEVSELLAEIQTLAEATDARKSKLEECVVAISTILYCGRHQKELIDDVLTVSKLDSNLLSIFPVPTCPEDVVNQAINMFQMNMRATGITWETRVERSDILNPEQLTVLMDPGRVVQVLINLIGNAVKFMEKQTTRRLVVSLSASKDSCPTPGINFLASGRERSEPAISPEWSEAEPVYIHFSIQDTGPGLTQEEMQALFARFKQASPRTHAQYGGSGLGLFISRELTEFHGGAIGVASSLGQGSTFAFYIKGRRIPPEHPSRSKPAVQNTPHRSFDAESHFTPQPINHSLPAVVTEMTSRTKELTAPKNHARTKTCLTNVGVLVIEDNIINQQVLSRQLTKLGCRVTTANHGKEALDILQTSTWWRGDKVAAESAPDLSIVLCDLEMPVMDGRTCVGHIRKWQADGSLHDSIPVLAVTGNARVPIEEAKEWGFDSVVSKPFSVKSLLPLFQGLDSPA